MAHYAALEANNCSIKMKSKLSITILLAIFGCGMLFLSFKLIDTAKSPKFETGIFTDPRDGKTYLTIKIGSQWLMSENFAFRPDIGNYWAYGNDTANIRKYGYLYDWETAMRIAPKGWHLPSLKEWKTLRKSLGGSHDVIKSPGATMETAYMQILNTGGFSATFGGIRKDNGQFQYKNQRGDFWSSTKGGWFANGPYNYIVDSNDSTAYFSSVDFASGGKSVRLFKD